MPAGYTVVSPGMTQQGPMIVNVGAPNSHQPITIGSQQVQFVQVSTVPTVVQALPTGLIQVTPAGQVATTAHGPSIAVGTQGLPGVLSEAKSSAAAYRIIDSSPSTIGTMKGDTRKTTVG